MIEKVPTNEVAGVDSGVQDGLRINIRLLPSVHGALFEELAGVSRGFRTARAIQLMTIGLTHERARISGTLVTQTPPEPPTPSARLSGSPPNGDENRLFVSAVLESSVEAE